MAGDRLPLTRIVGSSALKNCWYHLGQYGLNNVRVFEWVAWMSGEHLQWAEPIDLGVSIDSGAPMPHLIADGLISPFVAWVGRCLRVSILEFRPHRRDVRRCHGIGSMMV